MWWLSFKGSLWWLLIWCSFQWWLSSKGSLWWLSIWCSFHWLMSGLLTLLLIKGYCYFPFFVWLAQWPKCYNVHFLVKVPTFVLHHYSTSPCVNNDVQRGSFSFQSSQSLLLHWWPLVISKSTITASCVMFWFRKENFLVLWFLVISKSLVFSLLLLLHV